MILMMLVVSVILFVHPRIGLRQRLDQCRNGTGSEKVRIASEPWQATLSIAFSGRVADPIALQGGRRTAST